MQKRNLCVAKTKWGTPKRRSKWAALAYSSRWFAWCRSSSRALAVTRYVADSHAGPGDFNDRFGGAWQAYPVFGPDLNYGAPASIEYTFALAYINAVRKQCNQEKLPNRDQQAFPPLTDDQVEIDSDNVRAQVVSSAAGTQVPGCPMHSDRPSRFRHSVSDRLQTLIKIPFTVPAPVGSDDDRENIVVVITTLDEVDDPPQRTAAAPDVDVEVNVEGDESGYANDFQAVVILRQDDTTGAAEKRWTCDYTKADGSLVDSTLGGLEAGFDVNAMSDAFDVGDDGPNNGDVIPPQKIQPAGRRKGVFLSDPDDELAVLARTITIPGRQFLPKSAIPKESPARRSIVRSSETLSPEENEKNLQKFKALDVNYDVRTLATAENPPVISVPQNQGTCGSYVLLHAPCPVPLRMLGDGVVRGRLVGAGLLREPPRWRGGST